MSEQQRRESQPQISVSEQGGTLDGRGEVRMVPEEEARNYYGRAVLKEPTWKPEIPWYFFAGGLAGPSSGLALVARLAGNDRLARRAHLAALGGAAVSPVVLIADTSVPVWHEARRELPLVFAASSAASAGAAAAILTPVGDAGPARRLAVGGALLEVGAVEWMKGRL